LNPYDWKGSNNFQSISANSSVCPCSIIPFYNLSFWAISSGIFFPRFSEFIGFPRCSPQDQERRKEDRPGKL
jgi:hypothetical protein